MWAALCVGVYGLLRAGEFCIKSQKSTPLLRSQVTWNDDHIVIHLLESETDVFREGVDIRIYSNSSSTCPVAALRRCWLSAPRQTPGSPLFQDDTGAPLTYTTLLGVVRHLALCCGIDPSLVGTHSLRLGGASTLAILGYPSHVIRNLGRWSSLTYQLYTRINAATFKEVSMRFASASAADQATLSPFGVLSPAKAAAVSLDNIDVVFNS